MNKTILKLNCFKPEVNINGKKFEYSSVSAALLVLDRLGVSNYSIVY